jgi:hypothetical protein
LNITSAYSANQCAMSRLSQPPRSSSAAGKSQWNNVAFGAMPFSSSSSISRE